LCQRLVISSRDKIIAMNVAKEPHPVDAIVGARLRSARVAKGLTQAALAKSIGVAFQQVQKYENGSNRVSASMLVEIADVLGTRASRFLEGLGKESAVAGGGEPENADEAREFTAIYRLLPKATRAAVLQLTRSLAEGERHSSNVNEG
jgi:transcriptional regulator with XRE-family HTH domain